VRKCSTVRAEHSGRKGAPLSLSRLAEPQFNDLTCGCICVRSTAVRQPSLLLSITSLPASVFSQSIVTVSAMRRRSVIIAGVRVRFRDGRVIAPLPLRCWFLAPESRVQPQVTSYSFHCRRIDIRTGLSSSFFRFPQLSTIPPLFHVHLSPSHKLCDITVSRSAVSHPQS
jgi:hypothetical protein